MKQLGVLLALISIWSFPNGATFSVVQTDSQESVVCGVFLGWEGSFDRNGNPSTFAVVRKKATKLETFFDITELLRSQGLNSAAHLEVQQNEKVLIEYMQVGKTKRALSISSSTCRNGE